MTAAPWPLLFASLLWLATAARVEGSVAAITPAEDSFVREAAPLENYGGGGSVGVSGNTAVNSFGAAQGSADAFLKFFFIGSVQEWNDEFGPGGWTITAATLKVTEVAEPGNAIFNRGVGSFEIRWIVSDDWEQGSGRPNAPDPTGILWQTKSLYLNPAADKTLGTFSNTGLDGGRSFVLALPSEFLADMMTAGNVSFYLTATSPDVGFNFRSSDYNRDPSQAPVLQLTAQAIPESGTLIACFVVLGISSGRRVQKPSH